MVSRTERYFLDLFLASSLPVAAERAAESVKIKFCSDPSALPVDVFNLAQANGLKICQDLPERGATDAVLIPRKHGYLVRLRRDVPTVRKRFSLAHELGHTFFYRDNGQGPRHAIGILDRTEHEAEERACDHFAGFLLMPIDRIRERFHGLAGDQPSEFLRRCDSACLDFLVSKEAFIRHAGRANIDGPPYLVVRSSFRPNPRTKEDPDLRTDWFATVGGWRRSGHVSTHHRLWPIGLKSACQLYHEWSATKTRGVFALDGLGHLVHSPADLCSCREDLSISINLDNKWRLTRQTYISANCLYTWDNAEGSTEAYVISVAAPTGGDAV